jgi:ribosome-binding protein aMBF1 (putative translation factor)
MAPRIVANAGATLSTNCMPASDKETLRVVRLNSSSGSSHSVDNRIRLLREARGLSLETLAAEAGTENQQISLLESGKRRLTVDWLLRLSHALTCLGNWLQRTCQSPFFPKRSAYWSGFET